jgi:hypothetical protein
VEPLAQARAEDNLPANWAAETGHVNPDGTTRMIVSIEREHNTPTPGKSPRYRARVRTEPGGPAIFISASNFGSVAGARNAMDDFFGPLKWTEGAEGGDTRIWGLVSAASA